MLKSFNRLRGADSLLNRIQDSIHQWTQQIVNIPIISGVLLEDISLTTGSNSVEHKLGRKLRGWWVVDKNANVTIYRSAAKEDKILTLTASGSVTVSIWVF